MASTGCVLPARRAAVPVASYQPPVVRGEQLRIEDASGHYQALVFEGQWHTDGARACATGDIGITTPAGRIALSESDVCITSSPLSLTGEARVPFPALGLLARAGVHVDAPRAHLSLALGRQLGGLELNGESMQLHPEHYYLVAEYATGFDVSIGRVSLSTPGAGGTLLIAPQEPMVYVAGDLAGLLTGGAIDGAAFGFSAGGRLPLAPRNQLYDGRRWQSMRVDGHLYIQGEVPLAPYPIAISGRMVVDTDADRDGVSVFAGDTRDLRIAADGALSIGYSRAGFGLSFDIADASIVYDASAGAAGAVYFNAASASRLFEGTPLAAFEPQNSSMQLYGYYRGVDEFALVARADARMGGFELGDAELVLDTAGVRVKGRLGLANLGAVEVTGAVRPNGSFALTGHADLRPGGLRLANARVSLSPSGVHISGGVRFLGSRFDVSGTVRTSGQFSLTGSIAINVGVVRGRVALGISNHRVSAAVNGKACIGKACVSLPGIELDSRGKVCPTFPVLGRRCVAVMG